VEAVLKVGTWQGKATYGCPYCPWNSLDEAAALDHVWDRHKERDQPKPVNGQLFDAAGNLIAKGHA
jgi:hypothetical protein